MIGIGIIGCGKQAEKHIKSLQKINGIGITVSDQVPTQAEAMSHRYGTRVATVEEILRDESIKGIIICTPTATHTSIILQAFSFGKDIFCEKPLCTSLAGASSIADSADANKRHGLVGYIYRYAPVFQLIHKILQKPHNDSPLGNPVMALLRIGGRGSHQLWKHRQALEGGAMNEMFVHMLDLAIWLFGDVAEAKLMSKLLLRPQREIQGIMQDVDAEDFVLAELVTSSGVHVYIQADLLTPGFIQHVEVQGDEGSFIGSIQEDIPSRLFCSRAVEPYKVGWNLLDTKPVNLLDEQMAHFIRLIKKSETTARAPLRDSIEVTRVLNQLNRC